MFWSCQVYTSLAHCMGHWLTGNSSRRRCVSGEERGSRLFRDDFYFFVSLWKAAEQNTSWTAVKVCISENNLFTVRNTKETKISAAARQMSRSSRRGDSPRSAFAPGIALQSHANSCVKDGFLHSHGSQVLLGSRPNHGAPPEGSSPRRFVILAHSSTSLAQSIDW